MIKETVGRLSKREMDIYDIFCIYMIYSDIHLVSYTFLVRTCV